MSRHESLFEFINQKFTDFHQSQSQIHRDYHNMLSNFRNEMHLQLSWLNTDFIALTELITAMKFETSRTMVRTENHHRQWATSVKTGKKATNEEREAMTSSLTNLQTLVSSLFAVVNNFVQPTDSENANGNLEELKEVLKDFNSSGILEAINKLESCANLHTGRLDGITSSFQDIKDAIQSIDTTMSSWAQHWSQASVADGSNPYSRDPHLLSTDTASTDTAELIGQEPPKQKKSNKRKRNNNFSRTTTTNESKAKSGSSSLSFKLRTRPADEAKFEKDGSLGVLPNSVDDITPAQRRMIQYAFNKKHKAERELARGFRCQYHVCPNFLKTFGVYPCHICCDIAYCSATCRTTDALRHMRSCKVARWWNVPIEIDRDQPSTDTSTISSTTTSSSSILSPTSQSQTTGSGKPTPTSVMDEINTKRLDAEIARGSEYLRSGRRSRTGHRSTRGTTVKAPPTDTSPGQSSVSGGVVKPTVNPLSSPSSTARRSGSVKKTDGQTHSYGTPEESGTTASDSSLLPGVTVTEVSGPDKSGTDDDGEQMTTPGNPVIEASEEEDDDIWGGQE